MRDKGVTEIGNFGATDKGVTEIGNFGVTDKGVTEMGNFGATDKGVTETGNFGATDKGVRETGTVGVRDKGVTDKGDLSVRDKGVREIGDLGVRDKVGEGVEREDLDESETRLILVAGGVLGMFVRGTRLRVEYEVNSFGAITSNEYVWVKGNKSCVCQCLYGKKR